MRRLAWNRRAMEGVLIAALVAGVAIWISEEVHSNRWEEQISQSQDRIVELQEAIRRRMEMQGGDTEELKRLREEQEQAWEKHEALYENWHYWPVWVRTVGDVLRFGAVVGLVVLYGRRKGGGKEERGRGQVD